MQKLKMTIDSELSGLRVGPALRAKLLRAAEREARRQRQRRQARRLAGMAGIAASLLVAVGLAMLTRGLRPIPGGDGATPPFALTRPDETTSGNRSGETPEATRASASEGAMASFPPRFTSVPIPAPTEQAYEGVIAIATTPLAPDQAVEYLGEDVEMASLSYNGRVLIARFLIPAQPVDSVDIDLKALSPSADTSVTPALEYTGCRVEAGDDGRLDLTVMALLSEAAIPENIHATLLINGDMLAVVATGPTQDIQGVNMTLTDKARLREYDVLEDIDWQSTRGLTADLALNGGTFWLAPPVVIADLSLELVRYDVGGPYYHVSARCAAQTAGVEDAADIDGAQRPLTQLLDAGLLPCPACMPDGEADWDLSACTVENSEAAAGSIPLQDLDMVLPAGGAGVHIAGWRDLDSQAASEALYASVTLYGALGSGEYFTNATRLDVGAPSIFAGEETSASAAEDTINAGP